MQKVPYGTKWLSICNHFFYLPKKDFWEKTEFYSDLKQSAVNDDDYENSKYLYHTLKMRHLGDLNDLYNVQDVILLSEIIENRFETMHKTLKSVTQLVQWVDILKEKCLKLFWHYLQNLITLKFFNRQ